MTPIACGNRRYPQLRNPQVLLIAVLILQICIGGKCTHAPKRPLSISDAELNSAAYDRFFALVGSEQLNRDGDKVRRRAGAIWFTKQSQPGPVLDGGKGAACGYILIRDATNMVISAAYNADKTTDPLPMQLVVALRRTQGDMEAIGELGNPVIMCDLTESQCESVLNDGVPRTLINATIAWWRSFLSRTGSAVQCNVTRSMRAASWIDYGRVRP